MALVSFSFCQRSIGINREFYRSITVSARARINSISSAFFSPPPVAVSRIRFAFDPFRPTRFEQRFLFGQEIKDPDPASSDHLFRARERYRYCKTRDTPRRSLSSPDAPLSHANSLRASRRHGQWYFQPPDTSIFPINCYYESRFMIKRVK